MINSNAYKNMNYSMSHNKSSEGGYVFLLYLSFVWLSFFTSTNSIVWNLTLGYGQLFDFNSGNLFYEVFNILVYAAIELAALEVLFWIYRHILSYRVYTFVVPTDKIRKEFRAYYIIRNIVFGVLVNLCYLYPILYNLYDLFKIVTTLFIIVLFAYNIQKKYSEPIIAHFVFRNFYKPLFIYELILGFAYFWGCM